MRGIYPGLQTQASDQSQDGITSALEHEPCSIYAKCTGHGP